LWRGHPARKILHQFLEKRWQDARATIACTTIARATIIGQSRIDVQ